MKRERSVRLALPEDFRPYSQGSHFSDGKIRFSPAPQQVEFTERPCEAFPLRLISPPGPFILNSTMGNVAELMHAAGDEPTLLIHPLDAMTYGIHEGQPMRVSSINGSIIRKAIVTDDTRRGVLTAPGQWWPKLSPDRRGLNELTSQELTDLGGGSLFGNAMVRVSSEPARE